ncbi:PAS domain-containing hybrid sensor histidine kinase/response regulator [uncultured Kiloniella sp.]|uniref:PAS domain-containing hybrid sensor histidine kinase/response regulator n=1 Tax=uncultured Kiloniella sp. TaxID=1133091 RepID=UPI0026395C41|nr:PAS domain-containing hybrid sensor histidine kinase/response regulator [uncultured Kiloniella sp.]
MNDIVLSDAKSGSALFQSIWQTVVDGMIVINHLGIIQMVNPATLKVFGYTEEELIGKNVKILMPNRYSSEHDQYLSNFMGGGPNKIIGIGRIVEGETKDGQEISMYLAVSELMVGDQVCFVGILRDLTEKVRAENDILRAKEEAERANMAKSHFLSSMSHELRTPMNTILGFAQLLQVTDENQIKYELYQEAVQHILKSGDHLLNLIDDVLDLSKIEAGIIAVSLEDIDVNEIVDECIDLTKFTATSNNIKVVFKPDNKGKTFIHADRGRVRQSLINLISNGIKYNREDGSVTISFETLDNGFVRIKVTDTGYGIPERQHEKLFIPFDRLGLENSAIEGSGVGLAITQKIVRMMQGDIGFSSTPDGSQFWIDLPAGNINNEMEVTSQEIEGVIGEAGKKMNGRILYIEDNPSNIALLKQIVQKVYPGIVFDSCISAELGLEYIQDHPCDMIFMDINLPGMSGIDAMKCLERLYRDLPPVVAITADVSKLTISKIKKQKFSEMLAKPINLLETVEVLERYL